MSYTMIKEDDVFTIMDDMGHVVDCYDNAVEAYAALRSLNHDLASANPGIIRHRSESYGNQPKRKLGQNNPTGNNAKTKKAADLVVVNGQSMQKSQAVRLWCVEAKQQGQDQQVVVERAIAEFKMKRSLANQYVRNNWNKVEVQPITN